jgi:hypothetical protein
VNSNVSGLHAVSAKARTITFQVVSVIANGRHRETMDLSRCMPFQVPISYATVMFGPSPGLFDSAPATGAVSTMAHVSKRIAESVRRNRLPRDATKLRLAG